MEEESEDPDAIWGPVFPGINGSDSDSDGSDW
jgi:hypothetical protein